MRRAQVEDLLRELGRVAGRSEVVIVGSQSVHAFTDAAPAEVLVSLECDVLLDEGDAAADIIREQLGPQSPFRAEKGYYVDAVPPGLPLLPDGWRERLRSLDAGGVIGRCLEINDLAVSKLAAGRLKDYEFVAALVGRNLIEIAIVRKLIDGIADLRLRAILLARLQIVLESLGIAH